MAPTFASAAAGTNANSTRGDSGGDWPRRVNGATQTFRRPSHATTPSSSAPQPQSRDISSAQQSAPSHAGVYVPPHAQSNRNGSAGEGRYSRNQLLQLFKAQREFNDAHNDVSDLCIGGWEPHVSNGALGASWGRKDEYSRDGQSGVDACWDHDGSVAPLSLAEMTEDEKEAFGSNVNSPLKPPAQANKDGTSKEGLSLRKTSVSHGATGAYGVSSPTTSARPGTRRRDTGEAFPFPSSPAASRFSRDESSTVTPPPALVRRRTDYKDQTPGGTIEEREKDKGGAENAGPFGSVKRTTTAPFSAGANTSGWTSSPMGAFGSFANPQSQSQSEKKPGLGSVRGESRFKGLMSKGSWEDVGKGPKEKGSLGNLGKMSQGEPAKQPPSWMETRSSRPMSNDTDPFPDDDFPSGSAALGGNDDMSPSQPQRYGTFGTPHRPDPRDETGFSAFGMTADNTGLREIFHGAQNFPHQTPHRGEGHEPMSPTDTNPYQSPDHARHEHDDDSDGSDLQNRQYPGMGSFPLDPSVGAGVQSHPLGGLGRPSAAFEAAADRSQTSSVGPSRGFAGFHGLGTLPGLGGGGATWGTGQPTLGTPQRERGLGGGFDGILGSTGEAQSPSLAGLGNSSLFGGGHGSVGRTTSRLGSLFPTSMQEQMRNEQHRPSVDDGSSHGDRQHSMTGSLSRGVLGSQAPGANVPIRDTDSPFRGARNAFDDFSGGHMEDSFGPVSGAAQPSNLATTSMSMAALNQTRTAQASAGTPGMNSPAASQPPAPQQRTMVMPDRIRWIYRDPSGNTQGPFSGLEMHDWYKSGYFSPELLVKKHEDAEYEPLALLIRRIGNSREPFLVPQIGIAHGPPTTTPGNTWAGSAASSSTGGAQPPFANSFPSFGTTLTADQQNALERRKQEEQYLMARQKEHLAAQQQAIAKIHTNPHGILPQQLHHHSSAHSLHSQPSYGSITSPGGYQPSPTQAPLTGGPQLPGLHDNTFRAAPVPGLGPIGPGVDALGNIREEDIPGMMDRLNLGRGGQPSFGTPSLSLGQQQSDSNAHSQQVAAMLNDRARLQREQAEHDALNRQGVNDQVAAKSSADRLQQFQDLRVQTDMDQHTSNILPIEGVIGKPPMPTTDDPKSDPTSPEALPASMAHKEDEQARAGQTEPLSLTEQVQKAASAKQTPQPQSAWSKVEPAIHPFPPPPSQSPLPAPAAQRKPIVADSLATETRSRPETPSADTPSASIAPWAKEPVEAPRGPSLKEIQETEARKAAEREAVLAAARREAFEKEMQAAAQSPTLQPGLPSSSTWGSGVSPSTPAANSASAWAKPAVGKSTAQQTANHKKTLQQIQKEEEARKQRVAAQAVTNVTTTASPTLSSGKRYADLASKQSAGLANVGGGSGGGAWTTVGASGKTKAPAGPAPAAPVRSTSTGVAPPAAKKPVVTRPTATMGSQSGKVNAEEEFRKWAVNELRGELNKGINVEDFTTSLLSFPAELELLVESVHSASSTIDSRHFAEEFLRRRKLADKGIVDDRNTSSPAENKSGGGGWSEVAKKGGQSQQQQQAALESGNFKVVATKKGKAGKR